MQFALVGAQHCSLLVSISSKREDHNLVDSDFPSQVISDGDRFYGQVGSGNIMCYSVFELHSIQFL